MSGKRSAGQPAYGDAEALKEIRKIRHEHPKWSITKAALAYAASHPEEKANPTSVARRLADKLRRQMGQPQRPRAHRHRLLQDLQRALYQTLKILEELLKLEGRR